MQDPPLNRSAAIDCLIRSLFVIPLSLAATTAWAEMSPSPSPALALRSPDGNNSISFHLAAQLRYQYLSRQTDDGREGQGLVEVRRVRPSIKGNLLTEKLTYGLQLSTAPGSLELVDLFLDYSFLAHLKVRGGQWKIPFTRYRIQSFKKLTLADWALPTRTFGAERQMGLAFHNGYETPPRLEYEAGIFTGVNARAAHATSLATLYGEALDSPSDLVDPGSRADLRPALVAHLAYNSPGINTRADTDWQGGPLRVSLGLSGAWNLNPRLPQDLSLRIAPEVLIKAHGLSFSGIFYLGFSLLDERMTSQHLAFTGGLLQASYVVHRRVEVAVRYAVVNTDDVVLANARQRAQQLIDMAVEPEARSTLTAQYQQAGALEQEQEVTVGVNLYLLGQSLKWQNDLGWLISIKQSGRITDIRYRSQLQWAF